MHNKTPEPQEKGKLGAPQEKLPPDSKQKEVQTPKKDFMSDPVYNRQYLDC